MLDLHHIIAIAAVLLSFIGSGIYITSILRGQTKPHFYTHFIWGILTLIAFIAQVQDNGGAGTWATGATVLTIFLTSLLALKYGEKEITRSDKISLAAALLAIIPWLLTDNPLWSVVLVTLIDMLAYYPTIRKSWHKPDEEKLTSYTLGSIKFFLSVISLDHISLVTALYPCAIILANTGLQFMCLWRRKINSKTI